MYVSDRNEGTARETVNNDRGAVSVLVPHAVDRSWIDSSDRPEIDRFDSSGRLPWLDRENTALCMAELRPRFRPLMQFLIGTGARNPRRFRLVGVHLQAVREYPTRQGTPMEQTIERTPAETPTSRAAVTALLGLGAAVGACGGGADGPAPGIQPEPDRPVYRGTADVDPESGTLEAEWTIRFVADSAQGDRVTFLLSEGVDVERLSGPAVDTFRVEGFEQADGFDRYVVEFQPTPEPGSVVELEVAYAGELRTSPAENAINRIDASWVELGADAGWHPLFYPPDQQLRAVVRIRLPAGWSAVSSGSVTQDGDTHLIRNTLPQPDVAFAAAPDMETATAEAVTVSHPGADSARVRRLLTLGSWAVEQLNDRFGEDDPLPRAGVVLAPRGGPSYARNNYLVFGLGEELPGDRELVRLLCHEFSHYWSMDADPFSPHNWLNESFAELVGGQCVRERLGEAAYDSIVDQWRAQAEGQPPVWAPGSSGRPPPAVSYRKGPLLLHRLEERTGAETFDRFLTRYMTGRIATTKELLILLEDVTGPDAREGFEEALAEEG